MDKAFEVKTPFETPGYLYTLPIFDILNIVPDEVDRKKIKRAINKAKQKAKRTNWVIKGKRITEAMITEFEKILDCPMYRTVNEIVAHRPHQADVKGLEEIIEEARKIKVEIDDCKVEELKVNIRELIDPLPHFPCPPPTKKKVEFVEIREDIHKRDLRDEIFFDL